MNNRSIFLGTLIICVALSTVSGQNDSSALLKTIQEKYWQNQLKDELYLRLKYGLPIETLPDPSFEKAKKDAEFGRSILEQLKKVDSAELNHEELLSLKVLDWQNSRAIESVPFFYLTSPLTPYASPFPTIKRVFAEFLFSTNNDFERYLKLLKEFAGVVKTCEKLTAEQAKLGILLPKEELQLVIPFLASMNQSPQNSPFNVSGNRVKQFGPAGIEFQKNVSLIIEKDVNRALKKLIDFIEDDYSDKAPQRVGLSQYPLGKDYYRFLVRFHTTTQVTPDEVHGIGLKQMSALLTEMKKIQDRLGFKGSRSEFHKALKKDSRFLAKTPDEIGQRLMSHIRRIEPKIKDYFTSMPKAPYGVKRLDPSLEGSMTFGYYEDPNPTEPSGYYYYNGSKLNERSLLSAASLIFHELLPGHHFQINLQTENTALPEFRRNTWTTAYVEGWAEYATDVADEMGMYSDPYDRYGYLAAKAFLTARLVVDTGLNSLGWTRMKAMDYLRDNTLMSEAEIKTETLRYCCDIPGQALAYRIGATKIMALREKTRTQMGSRFDIRKFHEAVLGSGALPMTVLEEHLDWFASSGNQSRGEPVARPQQSHFLLHGRSALR